MSAAFPILYMFNLSKAKIGLALSYAWLAIDFLLVASLLAATLAPPPANAQSDDFEARAERALLLDVDSESILYEKKADEPFAPGNMAKLMTLAVVFDAIKDNRTSLSASFSVSEHAWRTGGAPSGKSTMFAEIHSKIAVRDLIKGAIIHYGNDGYIALAEGLAGSEASFAGLMNDLAGKLGMENSVFTNPTGDPDPAMVTTARDMAHLALYLKKAHPGLYRTFSTEDFEWNSIYQRNRNPLLGLNLGADGLITAFDEAAGYGLVASTQRDNRRQILVISGLPSPAQRVVETRRMLNFGIRGFDPLVVFDAGVVLGAARVFGGEALFVEVVTESEVRALLPREGGARLSAQLRYRSPLIAPIEEGQQIGVVEISRDGQIARTAPVFAGRTLGRGAMPERALSSLMELAAQAIFAAVPN